MESLSAVHRPTAIAAAPEPYDAPPADAPRPPLEDYIDLSSAARQVLEAPAIPPPPAEDGMQAYRQLSQAQVRLKAAPQPAAVEVALYEPEEPA